MSSDSADQIYQLKVTLLYTNPPIWRRFQVDPTSTLGDLHEYLVQVMGWQGVHQHIFQTGPLNRPQITFCSELFDDPESLPEDQVLLTEVFQRSRKDWLIWEYDMGDSWQHEVKFEEIVARRGHVRYPSVIDGAMACPPEDCGGVSGYDKFKAIMADRHHPEHQEMKKWYREYGANMYKTFDPNRFNVNRANRELGKRFPIVWERVDLDDMGRNQVVNRGRGNPHREQENVDEGEDEEEKDEEEKEEEAENDETVQT